MFSGNVDVVAGGGKHGYTTDVVRTANLAYQFVEGDIIGCAVDVTAGKIWFSKNGTWIAGDPAAGTSPTMTFTPGAHEWRFHSSNYSYNIAGTTITKIYPNAATQTYAAPSGFSPYQP
jgi:hypothetical protein